DAADNILITADPVFINVFDARFNKATTYISIADLHKINILAHGGDDIIQIDSSLDALKLRVIVDGGDGNDRISTGAGNDMVIGGAGDDSIYGNGGNDTLNGESGRDKLYGGRGRDVLF